MSSADFRNSIKVSNSLDPDQARLFIGPDLGPTCLQRLQQTTLVMPIGSTLFAYISQYMQQTTGADNIFRSIFFAGALRDSET